MNIRQAQLPQGWEIKMLSEIAEVGAGNSAPQKKELFINGRHPFIRTSDVGQIRKGFINSSVDNLNDEGIKKLKIKKKGTILFPKSGASTFLNHRVMMEIDGYVSSHLATIKAKDSVALDRYLLYFLITIDAKDLMQDIAYPSLKISDISAIEIPLPPLPEQQRIVAILDETFSAIDKAKANAEQNLKNAKELFESYLQGVFENGNWEERVLGDLCLLITKGSSPKWQGIKYVDEPGILFVTSENVGEGKMLLNKRKYVEEKFNLKDKKSILKKGDVLTNIVGASIGRTAIYDIDDVANINQAVCILRCNPELILNNYLMNLLNSPFLKKILHDNEVNTARANLSLGFFNKLSIPYPSIEEQQTIVRQLDALRAETQKLEAVYQQKIDDLEELKKSILQKAFAGELKTEKAVAV